MGLLEQMNLKQNFIKMLYPNSKYFLELHSDMNKTVFSHIFIELS